uniref:Pentatricopeptide repeat-containing protein n=1 Tax=Tanacetum cinerariifolium TaxID=118510 RepID=A0A6L2MV14_TANCI|nr:hypothetical protein [Tanacetum cinerariifolium]
MKSVSWSVFQMFATEYLRGQCEHVLSIELESCRYCLKSHMKFKKLEEARKVHDYFLRSGITGDVGLVHKMIDMHWDDGLEMYEQMRNNGLFLNEETFLAILDCAGADAIE